MCVKTKMIQKYTHTHIYIGNYKMTRYSISPLVECVLRLQRGAQLRTTFSEPPPPTPPRRPETSIKTALYIYIYIITIIVIIITKKFILDDNINIKLYTYV